MNLLSGAQIKCPLSVLERVRIIEVFLLKKIYENAVRTLETVPNRGVHIREVSVLRGSTAHVWEFLVGFSNVSNEQKLGKIVQIMNNLLENIGFGGC